MNLLRSTQFAFHICLAVILTTACDKKTVEEPALDIEMSYTPNPALVNTIIHFVFEPVSADANDLEITMGNCEIHAPGGADPQEMTVEKEEGHSHYEGDWTFTEIGTYELHFGYMHDEVMNEKEFTIVVVAN